MSRVDGIGLIEWNGCLFDPSQPTLAECMWVDDSIRAAGGTIIWGEGVRPYGVPSDRWAVRASDTQSGRSTVWYQWGRYERGETPSAANPFNGVYASEHTEGIATDSNAPSQFDMELRADRMRAVGHIRTVPSESWHFAKRFDSLVDYSAYFAQYTNPTPAPPPLTEEDIIMANIDDLIAAIMRAGEADDATKQATIVRNYVAESQNVVATALIFPDGSAVKLNSGQDVDAAVVAHAIVYGLRPTNDSFPKPRDKYGSQLVGAQWDAFWDVYPGRKVGFDSKGH